MFLNLGFGFWTKLHPCHSQVSVYIFSFFNKKFLKIQKAEVFTAQKCARGLAHLSVPTCFALAHWSHSLGRFTPRNPFTNRPGHTHSGTVTDCHTHTLTHLWVLDSIHLGLLTLQGQFCFAPPFVWSSI